MKLLPSAILLAGGKSSRFGSNKATAEIAGRTLTSLCVSNLLTVFEHVTVVTKSPAELGFQPSHHIEILCDDDPDYAAIIGMHRGLTCSEHGKNYITGCDMPGIVPELIEVLHNLISDHDCALRTNTQNIAQPLGGFYSKTALPRIEEQLAARDFKLSNLLKRLSIARLPYETLAELDPDMTSFQNINTQAELAAFTSQLQKASPTTSLEPHL